MSRLGHSQAEGERGSYLLFSLFILFRPSEHWMGPTRTGEGPLLYSVCDSNAESVETLSETHPEGLQLSGRPGVQSS